MKQFTRQVSNFEKQVSKWLQHIIDHFEKKTFRFDGYFAFKISSLVVFGFFFPLRMKLKRIRTEIGKWL